MFTQSSFVDTSTNFKKEIPVYLDGSNKGDTSYSFEYIRKDASELGLDFIENGYDKFQIRIWLGHSMAINRQVVVLKFRNRKWFAQVVYINEKEVVTDTGAYAIIERPIIKNVTPKSGWEEFIGRLNALNIFAILNEQDVYQEDGCGGADGMIYYFELATPQKYRFFHHCYPEGNLLSFALYLEKEFGFEYAKD
jgi:hypothetical protein